MLVLSGKPQDKPRAWFAIARDRLEPGWKWVVTVPNIAGAGSFEKELSNATGSLVSLYKHNCRAFHATEDGT